MTLLNGPGKRKGFAFFLSERKKKKLVRILYFEKRMKSRIYSEV
ncbi:NADH dehydrogenase subunit I [Iris pallida]|uniref:NADH dehydrogenase subunit I (Chloroplast) n=1 Tax=Iris pallida TaxID=29817 RepID=A0AAX6FR86_IRIPA|nr:NADH dehydrogenase subunit I [Iris pallida]